MKPLFGSEEERKKDFCELRLVPEWVYHDLEERGFFIAPASTKYHGSYEGGLYDHCRTVASCLQRLTRDNDLMWGDARSPLLVGMFHDLCKIDCYKHGNLPLASDGCPVPDPDKWEYNTDTLLKGHGTKSVMLLSRYISLNMEEIACIVYHMGAYTDKSEWADFGRAVEQYPNVLWTHHADMLASRVVGV